MNVDNCQCKLHLYIIIIMMSSFVFLPGKEAVEQLMKKNDIEEDV